MISPYSAQSSFASPHVREAYFRYQKRAIFPALLTKTPSQDQDVLENPLASSHHTPLPPQGQSIMEYYPHSSSDHIPPPPPPIPPLQPLQPLPPLLPPPPPPSPTRVTANHPKRTPKPKKTPVKKGKRLLANGQPRPMIRCPEPGCPREFVSKPGYTHHAKVGLQSPLSPIPPEY